MKRWRISEEKGREQLNLERRLTFLVTQNWPMVRYFNIQSARRMYGAQARNESN